MNHGEVVAIIWQIQIRNSDAEFRCSGNDDDLWIQVINHRIGAVANGRKWRISAHATKSEVVQTCFKAYTTWLEHEAREDFMYKHQAIFGPHFDVDELAHILTTKQLGHDVRSTPLQVGDHARIKDRLIVNEVWAKHRQYLVGTITQINGNSVELSLDELFEWFGLTEFVQKTDSGCDLPLKVRGKVRLASALNDGDLWADTPIKPRSFKQIAKYIRNNFLKD